MMIVSSHSLGVSVLCLHCMWSTSNRSAAVHAYLPSLAQYHHRRYHHNDRMDSSSSSSSSHSGFGSASRGRPLHLDAVPMELQLSDIIAVLDSPHEEKEAVSDLIAVLESPREEKKATVSPAPMLQRIRRTKKPRISTIKNSSGAISSLQPLRLPKSKPPRQIASKKSLAHPSLEENTHTVKKNVSKIKARRRPGAFTNRMHSVHRGTSARLSREEENVLTTHLKTLKAIMRIRDKVAQTKTSAKAADGSNSFSLNPESLSYETEELRRAYEYLPTDEEWAKACGISIIQLRRILIAGRNARTRLVDGNVGLVMSIAKRYFSELRRSVEGGGSNGVGSILTLQDMVQEGNLGLMEAAERFDSTKGARFGTYAVYWVRQRILRSIADNSRVIRLPAHVHTMLRNIRKTRADMEKEIGRAPSIPELAHELGMSPDKLQLYTASSQSVLSLEVPSSHSSGGGGKAGGGDQDKRTLGDFIASDSPTPEEDAEFDYLKRDIRAAIDDLGNDRERDVLIWRFGLDDGSPKTLGETAKRLGITKDRVRMVEARALNKLRHPQRNHRLKDYVGEQHHRTAEEVGGSFYESFNPRSGFESPDKEKKKDTLSTYSPEQIWSV